MMTYIWPLMILFSFLCAVFGGNMSELSSAVISSGSDTVSLILKLAGIICLWNGICSVAQKSGLTEKLCKLLSPILNFIFPKLHDKRAKEAIAMNITANILGLGNAATPLGLEAMSRLQKANPTPDKASDDMVKFVVINSAAVHLVPTTVALLREEYGSSSPTEILLPALLTSVAALSVGLSVTVILKKVFK